MAKKARKKERRRSERSPALMVLSRHDVEQYEPSSREICISISDPGAAPAGLSPSFRAVLRPQFDDVPERGEPPDVLFAEQHAGEIIAFVEKWPDVDRIVLHCNMGIS